MCRGSRSSLHYDPFHNLLCVVTGRKLVRCLSPAATRWVYPLPVWGESPNHSAVDFAAPDLARHPLFVRAQACELVAELQASWSWPCGYPCLVCSRLQMGPMLSTESWLWVKAGRMTNSAVLPTSGSWAHCALQSRPTCALWHKRLRLDSASRGQVLHH